MNTPFANKLSSGTDKSDAIKSGEQIGESRFHTHAVKFTGIFALAENPPTKNDRVGPFFQRQFEGVKNGPTEKPKSPMFIYFKQNTET